MIVLLGQPTSIQAYIETMEIQEAMKDDLIYTLPPIDMHHSNYRFLINTIKAYKPEVIITQNLEFLDTLLESDLEFEVVRTKICEGKMYSCSMQKEEVRRNREAWLFDPR